MRMLRLCSVLGVLAATSVAGAQAPGTLIVGGFGQYTAFDNALKSGGIAGTNITNGWGYGGRLGAVIAPSWEVEAEGSYTSRPSASAGVGNVMYGPVAARLVYAPVVLRTGGSKTSLLLGAGGVLTPYHNDGAPSLYTYKYGVSGDVGLRVGLGDMFALRGDAIADYHPTSPSMTNYRMQVGAEVLPDFGALSGRPYSDAQGTGRSDLMTDTPLYGTTELRGFGQYKYYDSKLGLDGGFGGGAGLGVFLTPRWELEGDGSYTSPKSSSKNSQGSGIRYDNGDFALRGNYNLPMTHASQLILGAGAVRTSLHRHDNLAGPLNSYTFGPQGLVGVRVGIAHGVALRADGMVDYLPGDFKSTDLTGRVGLSFLLGGTARTAPVQVERPVTPPVPTPLPVPVTPAPVVTVDTAMLRAPIYFDFDRTELRSDAVATLDAKIPVFQAHPEMQIRIEGNADERGSDEYNIALAQRRAASARSYLVSHGISESRIHIVSYGEERPVCREHNETCWSQNRRDDFVIEVQ